MQAWKNETMKKKTLPQNGGFQKDTQHQPLGWTIGFSLLKVETYTNHLRLFDDLFTTFFTAPEKSASGNLQGGPLQYKL